MLRHRYVGAGTKKHSSGTVPLTRLNRIPVAAYYDPLAVIKFFFNDIAKQRAALHNSYLFGSQQKHSKHKSQCCKPCSPQLGGNCCSKDTRTSGPPSQQTQRPGSSSSTSSTIPEQQQTPPQQQHQQQPPPFGQQVRMRQLPAPSASRPSADTAATWESASRSSMQQQQRQQKPRSLQQQAALTIDETRGSYMVSTAVSESKQEGLRVNVSSDPGGQRLLTISIQQSWPLPVDAVAEGITAQVTDGVLVVRVPRQQ